MKKTLLIPLLVLAVAISGCVTPYDGSPPKASQQRVEAVSASAAAWVSGPQGSEMFPEGIFASPLAVFDANRTFDHWVLPVKDVEGLYLGFLIEKDDTFSVPKYGVTKYPEPRHSLFSKTKEEAYGIMLRSSDRTADEIKEPYVSVVEGRGYHWASEVVVDGRHVGRIVVPISIIDPSDADRKDL